MYVLIFAHVQGRLLTISLFEKKSFIIRFFSDIKARFFILCLIITLLGVYIVIVGLMTLTLFQGTGHRCVRTINYKFHGLDSCPLLYCKVATYIQKDYAQYDLCNSGVYSREINNMSSVWTY